MKPFIYILLLLGMVTVAYAGYEIPSIIYDIDYTYNSSYSCYSGSCDVYLNGTEQTGLFDAIATGTMAAANFINTQNINDLNSGTYAVTNTFFSGTTAYAQYTFSDRYVARVAYKVSFQDADPLTIGTLYLQTYDGSSWSAQETIFANATTDSTIYSGTYALDENVQGIRLSMYIAGTASKEFRMYDMSYYSDTLNGKLSATPLNYSVYNGATYLYSQNVLFNPFLSLQFKTPSGVSITDYSLNGASYSSVYNSTILNLTTTFPDTISFLFNKTGYSTTNFSILINDDTDFSQVQTINVSQIQINIYDRESKTRLTGVNVSAYLVGTTAYNATTTTGQINITGFNIQPDTYQVIASSAGYKTEEAVFIYTGSDTEIVNIYMLANTTQDTGIIRVIVKNDRLSNIEGAICSLLEWSIPDNAFVTVSQAISNTQGQCYFNVELETKTYQLQATYEGNTKLTTSERFYVDGDERTLVISSSASQQYSFSNNFITRWNYTQVTATDWRINFYSSSPLNLQHYLCVKQYKQVGFQETFLAETCTDTSTTIDYSNTYTGNLSYNLVLKGYLVYGGKETLIGTLTLPSSDNIFEELDDYGLLMLIPVAIISIGFALGLSIHMGFGSVLVIAGLWISYAMAPNIINNKIAFILSLVMIGIMWAVYSRRSG